MSVFRISRLFTDLGQREGKWVFFTALAGSSLNTVREKGGKCTLQLEQALH